MEDENDMIVLIVENNTEIPNLTDISEEFGMTLDPETGEFSQAPFIKQESTVIKENLEELYSELPLKEIKKEEFSETLEIKEEIVECEYDLALQELSETSLEKEHKESVNLTCYKEELYLPHSNDFLKTEIQMADYELQNVKMENKCQKKAQQPLEHDIKKHGRKFMKPLSEHRSFVNELRCQFPELKQDEELLISTLANIMKDIKTPTPPANCFIKKETKFECTICGQLTDTKWQAERHYQYIHGERYLVCFACGTDFRSVTTLYKHEKRCCSKDAVIVLKARAQIIGDNGRNRPFLDEEKRLLERKEKSIDAKHRFLCSECPKEFSSKVYLEVHLRLHRGHRPFRCDICSTAYASDRGLKRHMQKHSSVQYICDICQKVFKIKVCLVAHLDTHLPEKKYGCIECGRRYTKKRDLESHMSIKHHHQPNPHPCAICNKGFSRISTLSYHMEHKHGMKIITRRALLNQLATLSEEDVKNEPLVKSAVIVKNVGGRSEIVAPR